MNLVIANKKVGQDEQGRYCINDLHRAAGGLSKDRPSKWLVLDFTKELIAEIEADAGYLASDENQAVTTRKGGNGVQGTYVTKELVYSYAMWVSPAFSLKVIRAYDALVTGGVSSDDETATALASDFKIFREAGMSEPTALFVANSLAAQKTGVAPLPQLPWDAPTKTRMLPSRVGGPVNESDSFRLVESLRRGESILVDDYLEFGYSSQDVLRKSIRAFAKRNKIKISTISSPDGLLISRS